MAPTARFYALDVMRGLAIALMILVNTPGSWSFVYPPLLHAAWDGFTFADIVFPGFLFVVGAAMAFALKDAVWSAAQLTKILKRGALMFGCGLFLNWFWGHELATIRIMGVLQRIALAYVCSAILVLLLPRRWLPLLAFGLLAGYGLLLQLSSAPFSLELNLVRQLDLQLLGAEHLYQGFGLAFDPEGLLSTMPAIVNVLVGYWLATGLQQRTALIGMRWLLAVGAVLVSLAILLDPFWPVNKALWSGSYVLLSSGLLSWILALLVYVVDIKQAQQLAQPWRIYGSNPLFIYMLSWVWAVLLERLLPWPAALSADPAQPMSAYQGLFYSLSLLLPAQLASLLFALLHVGLFWLISYALYQRKIFIKI